MTTSTIRVPLGTYSLDEADRIIEKFNKERNKYPERSPLRMNAHILRRSRGHRLLYIKDSSGNFIPIRNSNGDIPVSYAQRVSLYLIIRIKARASIGRHESPWDELVHKVQVL